MQSIPFRYGLANALIAAGVVAVACGGWPIWLVLGGIYLLGGPLDEAMDEDAGLLKPAARWFCLLNLYLTLPLLIVLTLVYLLSLEGAVATAGWFAAERWRVPLAGWDRGLDLAAATFLAGSCYAMFGATVAHELTHRAGRAAQLSAHGLLALMFNSSFTVFHVHGHHRYVGTERDPATARRGEHILAFFLRTLVGQYAEAFRHEAARMRSAGRPSWHWRNRVVGGQFTSLAFVAAAGLIAGWRGIVAFVAVAAVGRVMHEFVNYIQHYGLVRVEGTPIAARHTWDSYRALSNVMHYNLPRHADHHLFASKPYWELAPAPQAPVLPHGYMTMVLVALLPPLWRRSMGPRLADWDARLANDAERAAVRQRGWQGLC